MITVRDQVNADGRAGRLGCDGGRRGHRRFHGRSARSSGSSSIPSVVCAARCWRSGRATADQIGTQSSQIAAIKSDPDWLGGDYHGTGRSPDSACNYAQIRSPDLPR